MMMRSRAILGPFWVAAINRGIRALIRSQLGPILTTVGHGDLQDYKSVTLSAEEGAHQTS